MNQNPKHPTPTTNNTKPTTNNELHELKQIWLRADNNLHEPNCWRWHHKCAIARLIATIEKLQTTTPPPPPKTPKPKPRPTIKPTTNQTTTPPKTRKSKP